MTQGRCLCSKGMLAMVMAFSVVITQVHGAQLLVNGNFESSTGGVPTGWSYTQGDGPAILTTATSSSFTNIYAAGSSAALFTDGLSGGVEPLLGQTIANQAGGLLYAAWDFRLSNLTGSPWTMQIDDSLGALTRFNIDSTGNFSFEQQTIGNTNVMALSANVWYQVQVTLNMTNKTLSGVITPAGGSGTPFSGVWRITGGNAFFNRILFGDATPGGAGGNIVVDNLSLDRVAYVAAPEPSRLVLLWLAGFALLRQRRRTRR